MFAKLAKLQTFGSRRVASTPRSLAHANDNRSNTRLFETRGRTRRPNLVCRWRRALGDGRLECSWHIEPGTPGEEPGGSSTLSELRLLLSMCSGEELAPSAVT